MIPESVQREVQDFAAYFFREVTGRIPLQRAYHLPEITYNRSRSPEEEKELQEVDTSQERRNELRQLLSPGLKGFYDRMGKGITLNISHIQEGIPYRTITHETLHAVRDQIIPLLNLSEGAVQWATDGEIDLKKTPPKKNDSEKKFIAKNADVQEFFACLDGLVLSSIGGVDYHGTPIPLDNEHIDVTLKNLQKSANALGHLSQRSHSIFTAILSGNADAVAKLFSPLVEPQHHHYLLVQDMTEELVLSLYRSFECIVQDLQDSDHKDKDTLAYLVQREEEKFYNLWRSERGSEPAPEDGAAYSRANLIINENRERLLQEWPEAFTLSQEDVVARYFVPVQKKFDELVLRLG